MALPYPSLVFVPLDILTAEEMNQICANVNYVSEYATALPTSHVGQVIMSTTLDTAAKVSAIYGGTWQSWGNGRVPVGVNPADSDFSTVQKTGGEKTQALRAAIGACGGNVLTTGYVAAEAIPGISAPTYTPTASGQGSGTFNHSTPVYKSDGAIPTTLQPYITVYMWVRTA